MWGYNTLADNKQEEGSYQNLTTLAPWAQTSSLYNSIFSCLQVT